MAFDCDIATLERLEWPQLTACLADCAGTRRGAEACAGDLFAATRASALDRLAETDEARALLDAGEAPSLGGIADLRAPLEELGRGRLLGGQALARVQATLEAAARIRRQLGERSARTPRLAALAETLPDLGRLARDIARVVTPDGDIRDDASPALRDARRRVRRLQADIDAEMARLLRDPDVRTHLQDDFVTSRNERPVVPVRANQRQRVGGIVHGVSSSGTTVFVEPQAVIDLGNRLRLAEIEVEREVERLLRALCDSVAEQRIPIEGLGATLEVLDLTLARGRLSQKLDARAPEVTDAPVLALRELRHPLLRLQAGLEPEEIVPNDVVLDPDARCLVISGPNAGGKTVTAKAIGLAALSIRAGLHVCCAEESRLGLFDVVRADIGDDQDLRQGLSTFSARMRNLAGVLEVAGPRSLVIVDEMGDGTEPGEGASLAQAALEALVEAGAQVVATTHFNRLKELAGGDPRFANASAEFDRTTLRPTYRVHLGAPGSSGALFVAQRMGVPDAVVARARALLDHEDRRLEALTRDLSELRQQLDSERQSARRARLEGDAARRDYETRIERLRVAREQALEAMKGELESAFASARSEIADVMRDLQQRPRQGRAAGQAANRARQKLGGIRERSQRAEARHAPAPREATPAPAPSAEQLTPGRRVAIEGMRDPAVIVDAPDRRGRLRVRAGGAHVQIPLTRVKRVLPDAPPAPGPAVAARVEVERSPDPDPEAYTHECDLRGLRVDEALDRAEAHLHSVFGRGERRLRFIHGHGTGALRDAIRSWLRDLPEVAQAAPGIDAEGGNGVTVVDLR